MRTVTLVPLETGPFARLRRPLVVVPLGIAALVVVGALALTGLRVARPGALPGVEVAGLDVGGLEPDALAAALDDDAERRERAPVTVTRGLAEHTGAAADLGYDLDADATAEAVLARGRQTNPLAALADHLRATWATIEVAPVQHIDPARFDAWVADASTALVRPGVEGSLSFDGATITRIDPSPGAQIRRDELAQRLRAALLDPDDDNTVLAVAEPVTPETTAADVDEVLAVAQKAVSGPVALSREDTTATLGPDDIGSALRVVRDDGDLRLDIDPDAVVAALPPDALEAFDAEPADATFAVSGSTVSITPARDGFRFDPGVAAEQVLRLALSDGPREAALDGEVLTPDLSTAEAEELGIVEEVSSYTTSFTAGQSRVTNIQRIADLVDGALLRPGETFSVNGHVGERTAEKGFVGGGAIFDGEFVEQIGGGVSQFATTMYNAAYFGGYAIPQHKAHSYYISRYPVGREATLNYPNVDLKVRNNSPHGALVKTSHTATSVTVTFYGRQWVSVDSVAGERRDVTPPPAQTRENPDLAPGQERVAQSGREGFDITVTRVLTFPDGRVEREDEHTRYLPEPRIVERGPGGGA